MKWSKRKYDRNSYSIKGRKNGYKAEVVYNDYYHQYYFLTEKDAKVFNSLWENLYFQTEEDCIKACEDYIGKEKENADSNLLPV